MNNADAKKQLVAMVERAAIGWYDSVREPLAEKPEADDAATRLKRLKIYVEDLPEDHPCFSTLRSAWARDHGSLVPHPEVEVVLEELEEYGQTTEDPEGFCKRLAHELLTLSDAKPIQHQAIDAQWLRAS
ncbi:hypothetical protein QWY84_05545 [Aquisalimonas lutea]|uniref:hypothetical protein n=1 Tax=Aquisalimonas lutea TaxID=1327750 RepID=UPI0025B5F517|nr:hypothetical protein [Aquisalimonas lutea]MDN3517068.1 hypothetical protein [Aquisalimonas lutea]